MRQKNGDTGVRSKRVSWHHISMGRDPLDVEPEDGKWDLHDARLFLNREMTWLNFNRRVLFEAENNTNPLLERVKFLAIVASNLDEFYMKRIGGLKQLFGAHIHKLSVDGRTPAQQLESCFRAITETDRKTTEVFHALVRHLSECGIALLEYDELNEDERNFVRAYFVENVFPLLTPQGVDPAHPFPFISNLSLNLLVSLKHPTHSELSMARVKVPVGQDLPRFLRLGQNHRFVRLEDVVAHNLDLLFPGMEVESYEFFRVIRNANTEKEEEKADDLLEMMEEELRDRKFAPIVSVRVMRGINPIFKRFLFTEMEMDPDDILECGSMLGKRDLFEIAGLEISELHYESFQPIDHPRLKEEKPMYKVIRNDGALLLFHPYESFTSSVERFLKEASEDPKVRAIKASVYRTSSDSQIIHSLRNAAQNGKQVTVVVELKARFDEAANIRWAAQLEEAGIHVTYGVVGFKTHMKLILVVRKDFDGLKRYCHIGTGNYHAGTARLYTDFGLFVRDEDIGHDATELFNYLSSGLNPERQYRKFLMAPSTMKKELLGKIAREIKHHAEGKDGLIEMKLNALEDPDVVRALYRASQAGVKVNLVVRDTCRLRPGVKGLSESITVMSLIGRFLEHARLYYFKNGGQEEYYIGSADAMQRNLLKRVEVLAPVEDPLLKRELRTIMDVQLNDRHTAWFLQSDGSYKRMSSSSGQRAKGSQYVFMSMAERRKKAAARPKRSLSRGKSRKENWTGR